MPRQFYVNGGRAIRARSNYQTGIALDINYQRVPTGYQQHIPQSLTHPELVEAVTATQWKMMRCPVANIDQTNTLNLITPCWTNANTYSSP